MRAPKLSTYGFCHGEPGSMYALPARWKRHQCAGVGGQLGAVVAADERGRAAALGDEPVEHSDGVVGVNPPAALDGERLAGELVDHVQELEEPPVGGLVELEVQRPHMIRPYSAEPPGGHGRGAEPLALAPPLRDPQAFLAPQPLRPLAVHAPALVEQQLMGAAVPPPRPAARDPAQVGPQRLIVARARRLVALGRAVLADDRARPPLRQSQAVLQHPDRLAPTRRAHQFPLAISFSAATSST